MSTQEEITIRFDSDMPFAKEEMIALRKARLRVAIAGLERELQKARAALDEAEAEWAAVIGRTKKKPRKPVNVETARRGRPPKPPSEAHLSGLRLVENMGRIDKEELYNLVYKDRTTVRNRIRFWRKKGWIQENEDGTCTMQEGLLD